MADCHLKSNWDGTLSWGGVQVENFGFYLAILRLPVWGRPVVGGVEGLCMLTVQVGDSPETHASMHFTTVPDPHLRGVVVAAGVEKREYNGG